MSVKLCLHAAPATLVSLAVILALAGAGLVASSSGSTSRSRASGGRRSAPAAAKQPKCGDTITTDTTLHHNLTNCANNGIVIGADDITLDLNYHTIDGDGTASAGCDPQTEFCDVGLVNFGHDGVTVVHGSLRQFAGGVDFGEVRHNRLLGISASNNPAIGIQLFLSSRSLIRNSSGIGSTDRHDGTGLGLFDCDRVRVLHNSARRNARRGIATTDTNDSLIKGNRLSRNDHGGFRMERGQGNRIKRNRLVRNGAGITLGPGSHNVIARNRVSRGRDGIRIEKGHDNLVANNVVSHARLAGIRLGILHHLLNPGLPAPGGAHNTVRGNLVKASRVDGFLVNPKDEHSRLRHNTARGAGDDGFDVRSRTAKLAKNRALRNGDLGIAAVRGVIDGGRNRARGNGDPRQCTNIACD
jgi:parallel beta-helix repeat protein